MYTADAERHATGPEWMDAWQTRRAAVQYSQKLRGLADRLVVYLRDILGPGIDTPEGHAEAVQLLNGYTAIISPWAQAVADRMVNDVALRDARMWRARSQNISRGIHAEMARAPIADALIAMKQLQAELITSIPIGMANEVSKLVIETAWTGARVPYMPSLTSLRRDLISATEPKTLTTEIARIGGVTRARATLIGRTEVARVQTEIMKARSQHVGSTHYIWRSAGDEDVRPSLFLPAKTFARMNTAARGSHRLLDGTVHSWNDPPISGPNGERAHPGCIYNCRCLPEPILKYNDTDVASWRWSNRPVSPNPANAW